MSVRALGKDTEGALLEELGLTEEQIAAGRERGVW